MTTRGTLAPAGRGCPHLVRLPCALAALVVPVLFASGEVFADGDATLGPPQGGFVFEDGTRVIADGVGLDGAATGTIEIDVPVGASVRQVLLYWSYLGSQSDTEVELEGSIPVTGVEIGREIGCAAADLIPFAFRADITDLGLIAPGRNEILFGGIDTGPTEDGRADGAEIVVVIDEGTGRRETLALDGCDFAYGRARNPGCRVTEKQTLFFPPAAERQSAELILFVGDHEPGSERPSALEVEIELGPSLDFLNILVGSDGPRWDTIVIPIEIPAGASRVGVQLFSEDRVGSGLQPSSFTWVFAALSFLDEAPQECRFKYRLPDLTVTEGECVDVPVLLDSTCPIQGFSTAVRHDPAALTLDTIHLEGTVTADLEAEFFAFEIFDNGGTSGVILDFESPFEDQQIPPGEGRRIVNYRYCCPDLPEGASARTTPLEFVDGEIGNPVKENLTVVAGVSNHPELCPGSITCEPDDTPTSTYFICGGPDRDEEGNPLPPLPAAVGESRELCLYYCAPEDEAVGHAQLDHLQGLTMTLCFDCDLEISEADFRIPEDSITAAVGAEFVDFQVDDDPNDGDGCEMILGILVDALPPFDGQTLPPSSVPLKVACVDVTVGANADCGSCLPIAFCDGINGRGRVPLKNVYSAENQSFTPQLFDCELCVVGQPRFYRGDCNSNDMVEIADAASVVSTLFLVGSWRYEPRCPDACDCNDDGRFDLGDAVCILQYLFLHGAAPPAPGPGLDPETRLRTDPGSDPTADKLDCELRTCP